MTLQPLASFIARWWPGTRTPAGPDAADLGTAFGLDMSLRDADEAQASRALGSAAPDDGRGNAPPRKRPSVSG